VKSARPAGLTWGQGACECRERRLKADLGEDFQIITIGPAGENGCVTPASRTTSAARPAAPVWAPCWESKNIKAIAVTGHRQPCPVDMEGRPTPRGGGLSNWYPPNRASPNGHPKGTAGITDWVNQVGAFPTRNFQTSFADHHDRDQRPKPSSKNSKSPTRAAFAAPHPAVSTAAPKPALRRGLRGRPRV
jgi:aldehyde:ferredoxin oxidoreductase